MPRCPECPVESRSCVGEIAPAFCRWGRSDNPVERQSVVARSALLGEMPLGRGWTGPVATPTDGTTPAPPIPGLMLAGDLVAAMTKRLGIDRLTRYVTTRLGVDCCCAERQRILNDLDAKFRKFLGW